MRTSQDSTEITVMHHPPLRRWIQATACATAAAFFYSNVLIPPLAQANFWTERQKAVHAYRAAYNNQTTHIGEAAALGTAAADPTQAVQLLASLPRPQAQILQGLPTQIHARPLPQPLVPAQVAPTVLRSYPELGELPYAYGSLKDLQLVPGDARRPLIIHFQDAHLNPEAQFNIAAMLQKLLEEKKVGVVGVEAAHGPFDFRPFRAFPNPAITTDIASYLVNRGELAAASYVGITAPKDYSHLFWGVDDPQHYKANVEAIKRSKPLQPAYQARLKILQSQVVQLKAQRFNPNLRTLEAQVSAYREGALHLGAYVEILAAQGMPLPPQVQRFREVYHQEKTLDFGLVERERKALIERLVPKLHQSTLSQLVAQSIAYRSGQISYATYYQYLQGLCTRFGIILSRYPAMQAYVQYVLQADRITADALFKELGEAEEAALVRLTHTPEERHLLLVGKQLIFINHLVNLDLTPTQWAAWQPLRTSLQHLEERIQGFRTPSPPPGSTGSPSRAESRGSPARGEGDKESLVSSSLRGSEGAKRLTLSLEGRGQGEGDTTDLTSFERFYLEAEARDEAMVTNLLAKLAETHDLSPSPLAGEGSLARRTGAPSQRREGAAERALPGPRAQRGGGEGQRKIAVLVAGGFHSPGIARRLKDQQVSYVSLAPKITKLDTADGTKYLDVFVREKTPLEKLFTGEKLFVQPFEINLGVANAIPPQTTEFHSPRQPLIDFRLLEGAVQTAVAAAATVGSFRPAEAQQVVAALNGVQPDIRMDLGKLATRWDAKGQLVSATLPVTVNSTDGDSSELDVAMYGSGTIPSVQVGHTALARHTLYGDALKTVGLSPLILIVTEIQPSVTGRTLVFLRSWAHRLNQSQRFQRFVEQRIFRAEGLKRTLAYGTLVFILGVMGVFACVELPKDFLQIYDLVLHYFFQIHLASPGSFVASTEDTQDKGKLLAQQKRYMQELLDPKIHVQASQEGIFYLAKAVLKRHSTNPAFSHLAELSKDKESLALCKSLLQELQRLLKEEDFKIQDEIAAIGLQVTQFSMGYFTSPSPGVWTVVQPRYGDPRPDPRQAYFERIKEREAKEGERQEWTQRALDVLGVTEGEIVRVVEGIISSGVGSTETAQYSLWNVTVKTRGGLPTCWICSKPQWPTRYKLEWKGQKSESHPIVLLSGVRLHLLKEHHFWEAASYGEIFRDLKVIVEYSKAADLPHEAHLWFPTLLTQPAVGDWLSFLVHPTIISLAIVTGLIYTSFIIAVTGLINPLKAYRKRSLEARQVAVSNLAYRQLSNLRQSFSQMDREEWAEQLFLHYEDFTRRTVDILFSTREYVDLLHRQLQRQLVVVVLGLLALGWTVYLLSLFAPTLVNLAGFFPGVALGVDNHAGKNSKGISGEDDQEVPSVPITKQTPQGPEAQSGDSLFTVLAYTLAWQLPIKDLSPNWLSKVFKIFKAYYGLPQPPTYADVGHGLGITASAVSRRLRKGVKALSQHLGEPPEAVRGQLERLRPPAVDSATDLTVVVQQIVEGGQPVPGVVLNATYQKILSAYYLNPKKPSLVDIAKEMNVSQNTVNSHAARAIQFLAERLKQDGRQIRKTLQEIRVRNINQGYQQWLVLYNGWIQRPANQQPSPESAPGELTFNLTKPPQVVAARYVLGQLGLRIHETLWHGQQLRLVPKRDEAMGYLLEVRDESDKLHHQFIVSNKVGVPLQAASANITDAPPPKFPGSGAELQRLLRGYIADVQEALAPRKVYVGIRKGGRNHKQIELFALRWFLETGGTRQGQIGIPVPYPDTKKTVVPRVAGDDLVKRNGVVTIYDQDDVEPVVKVMLHESDGKWLVSSDYVGKYGDLKNQGTHRKVGRGVREYFQGERQVPPTLGSFPVTRVDGPDYRTKLVTVGKLRVNLGADYPDDTVLLEIYSYSDGELKKEVLGIWAHNADPAKTPPLHILEFNEQGEGKIINPQQRPSKGKVEVSGFAWGPSLLAMLAGSPVPHPGFLAFSAVAIHWVVGFVLYILVKGVILDEFVRKPWGKQHLGKVLLLLPVALAASVIGVMALFQLDTYLLSVYAPTLYQFFHAISGVHPFFPLSLSTDSASASSEAKIKEEGMETLKSFFGKIRAQDLEDNKVFATAVVGTDGRVLVEYHPHRISGSRESEVLEETWSLAGNLLLDGESLQITPAAAASFDVQIIHPGNQDLPVVFAWHLENPCRKDVGKKNLENLLDALLKHKIHQAVAKSCVSYVEFPRKAIARLRDAWPEFERQITAYFGVVHPAPQDDLARQTVKTLINFLSFQGSLDGAITLFQDGRIQNTFIPRRGFSVGLGSIQTLAVYLLEGESLTFQVQNSKLSTIWRKVHGEVEESKWGPLRDLVTVPAESVLTAAQRLGFYLSFSHEWREIKTVPGFPMSITFGRPDIQAMRAYLLGPFKEYIWPLLREEAWFPMSFFVGGDVIVFGFLSTSLLVIPSVVLFLIARNVLFRRSIGGNLLHDVIPTKISRLRLSTHGNDDHPIEAQIEGDAVRHRSAEAELVLAPIEELPVALHVEGVDGRLITALRNEALRWYEQSPSGHAIATKRAENRGKIQDRRLLAEVESMIRTALVEAPTIDELLSRHHESGEEGQIGSFEAFLIMDPLKAPRELDSVIATMGQRAAREEGGEQHGLLLVGYDSTVGADATYPTRSREAVEDLVSRRLQRVPGGKKLLPRIRYVDFQGVTGRETIGQRVLSSLGGQSMPPLVVYLVVPFDPDNPMATVAQYGPLANQADVTVGPLTLRWSLVQGGRVLALQEFWRQMQARLRFA